MNAGAAPVAAERLELSRSPTAEIAAAALDAKAELVDGAGAGADIVVVAVPRGEVIPALDAIRSALAGI